MEDLKELPEKIVLPDKKVEGRPLTSFEYEWKGHIKKRCLLHIPNDNVEIGCCQDDEEHRESTRDNCRTGDEC